MPQLLKNTILTLVTLGLLWGFHSAISANFALEKAEIFDAAEGEESPEKENCEIENWKFLNHAAIDFKIFRNRPQLKIQDETRAPQNIAAVPTSPPNA